MTTRGWVGLVLAVITAFAVGLVVGVKTSPAPVHIMTATNVYGCPTWITAKYSSAAPHWAIVDCAYQDETQSGGDTNIYVTVKNESGSSVSGVTVYQLWPDGLAPKTTINGSTDFAMGPSNCDPNAGRPGALTIYVESQAASDAVTGMCLPLNRHVRFFLTFQRTGGTAPPTPTTGATPDATPPTPLDCRTKAQFHVCFMEEMRNLVGGN